MKHTLYLDIGNSRAKLYQLDVSELQHVVTIPRSEYEVLGKHVGGVADAQEIIVASVRGVEGLSSLQQAGFKSFLIHSIHIPAAHHRYETPETLGVDRFLAALGAWSQCGKACVIVDAGTACTVDAITEEGIFLGGLIAPGLGLLEFSLATYAERLPQVERLLPEQWPGNSTKSSLQWGLTGVFTGYVQHFIQKYQSLLNDPRVIVTGGDAALLETYISGAERMDELVPKGMQAWTSRGWTLIEYEG